MTGKIDNIKIRMYNTGSVGDCLLLLFRKGETTSFSMLIDCGGIKTSAAYVNPCVQDITAACNGQLDLLVVTHQHEDHISGFNLARPLFDQLQVKETWMSWVEDPTDSIAVVLKDKYQKKLRQLQKETAAARANLQQLSRQTSNAEGFAKRYAQRQASLHEIEAALAFEAGDSHGAGLAAGRLTNEDAMQYVKKKGKKMSYRLPGEVLRDLPGAEGIKFYILGPPRDKDLHFLKIEMDEDEMYRLALAARADDSSPTSIQHITDSGITLQPDRSPFDKAYQLSGKEEQDFWRRYRSEDMKWRQIETDWLDTGGLALALTRFINNTSLAMALEFEGSGRVVLLPADAQSGNWMSWHKPDVMKSLKDKGGKDTNELLAATVFYKVGHHGSHNGTASHSGLDLVNSPGLVAFMPLVQDKVPAAWGGAANFPAAQLYQVLIDKTKGRIVRTDEGVITDPHAKQMRKLLPAADLSAFNQSFKKGGCYFEYTIQG